ncbi:hypothetical protein [Ochrobactrum sp. MC-1LL]|uniref:hypothetical protein n=1 Tax=Ochrobactrum sp. MC-1LL TaxID=2735351 RepID=UPI0014385DBD|nr:hypothetical protein [Ochrobactrum sp. MC-1LL]NKE77838.1 hypothetical protein [Ochrobactrum sp. MC-1LL]
MAEIKTGGPAFPRSAAEHSQGGHYEQDGMDLRDYFAAKVLVGLGTWSPFPETGTPTLSNPAALKARAEFSYMQADAMIAAREGGAK